MKYLVMETHPAYAVVLDERGRFLRAANLRYQVGQTVEDVVELQPSGPRRRPRALWAAAAAACLLLAAGGYWGYWRPNFIPYGTLRVQINPDVEFSVSRTDRVLDERNAVRLWEAFDAFCRAVRNGAFVPVMRNRWIFPEIRD